MKKPTALLITAMTPFLMAGTDNGAGDVDSRLSDSTYVRTAGRISLLVDSFPASLHPDDEFIPFPIAVGLDGKGGGITVSTGSFTLVDSSGRSHAVAAYEELTERYGKMSFDRDLIRSHPLVTGQRFDRFHRVHSSFFETTRIRNEQVHLAAFTWFRDVLYFPRPEGGTEGVLRLRLEVESLDDPLELRFRIPPFNETGAD